VFDAIVARGRVHDEVDDAAWLQAMLDFEAGLARAQDVAGVIRAEHAERISEACRAERLDAAAIAAAAAETGTPVVPLLAALRAQLPEEVAADVHRGATSQDVVDSAAMLIAARALEALGDDLEAASAVAAGLAEEHRATVMAGRTLLQQAVPISFGLKAAGWMSGLDQSIHRLARVRAERLAVQLGGAAGTLAGLGGRGVVVLSELARELQLAEPALPWHTTRNRTAELAGALGQASGTAGKIALDVQLLAQTEVGEAREAGPAGRGASSAMPHKRNPVAAVCALACARQAPGLVATLYAAMPQEHERAAGAWHAEWQPLTELLQVTGSAAAWLRDCLERLEIDPERMRANLTVEGDLGCADELIDRALLAHAGRAA